MTPPRRSHPILHNGMFSRKIYIMCGKIIELIYEILSYYGYQLLWVPTSCMKLLE